MPLTRSTAEQCSTSATGQNPTAVDAPTPNLSIAMKIPRFWKDNPVLWFAQIEAQFALHNVTNERTKYFIILADLDADVLSQVSDIVMNPPNDAYKQIKQRLIDHFSVSEENRIKTLLTNVEIGDKKPSALLREMKNLANGGVTEDFLRTMWLQRLPSQTQAILATSSETLDNLVKMADKIGDIQIPRNANVAEITSASELSEIKAQIQSINTALRNLNTSRRSRSRGSHGSSSRNSSSGKICYYHRKFKNRARKCRPPCSFVSNQSEN
ncbi:uncharacterized protein LOC119611311 [Lucilia sericata]|uniref:uncharacterized protein LOC119611311 n=1 Tax=Lucilia sericata TaxID=13632 RepID=UPI0018A7ED49|nr:uncharacterized protein LOC119611311 [Lucilia sericata]